MPLINVKLIEGVFNESQSSACAASVSLHWVKYCIGGEPIISVKRSASAERDNATARARR